MKHHTSKRFRFGTISLALAALAAFLPGCRSFKLMDVQGVPRPYLEPQVAMPTATFTTPTTPTRVVTPPLVESVPTIGPIGTPSTPAVTTQPEVVVSPAPVLHLPPANTTKPVIIDEPDTPPAPKAFVPPPPQKANVLPPLPQPPKTPGLTYKLKRGETLWDVGRMYGVSVNELAAYNNISNAKFKRLPIGLTLKLPPGASFVPESARPKIKPRTVVTKKPTKPSKASGAITSHTPKAKEPIPTSGTYTVKKNESLWLIGNRYGISVKDLMAMNNLKSDKLQIGQVLKLKGSGSKTPPVVVTPPSKIDVPEAATPKADDVKPDKPGIVTVPAVTADKVDLSKLKMLPHYCETDDSLKSIALMYDSRVDWILRANPAIKVDADLKKGIKIDVPVKED